MSNAGLWRGGNGGMAHAGLLTGSTNGTSFSSSATANTKGSYAQLIASTAEDIYGFWVNIGGHNVAAGNENYGWLADLAIGAAASEKDILSSMYGAGEAVDGATGTFGAPYFPLFIPKASRLSCRVQDSLALAEAYRMTLLTHGPHSHMPWPLGRATTYGAVVGSSHGTDLPDPASNNSVGAWAQLDAAIANDIHLLYMFVGQDHDSSTRTAIDIGVGAASSEVVVVPQSILFQHGSRGNTSSPACFGPIPVDIPAGVRLSARQRSSSSTRGARVLVIGLD